ncbi:hypothetical protein TNIN_355591 [Trichonephila inaurata madagascariensis]|uniref:Uncharacterized protein n=1 Tax=Trichonephila inaurata madagascariensis TaxID=2747483 RepID=A0A8X7BW93_9ARAC|nr:hypothetical protein TNIN_355591 [Trichonephila inaurata madagascariensis]
MVIIVRLGKFKNQAQGICLRVGSLPKCLQNNNLAPCHTPRLALCGPFNKAAHVQHSAARLDSRENKRRMSFVNGAELFIHSETFDYLLIANKNVDSLNKHQFGAT